MRFLYDLLLVGPGLNVPDDPSRTAVDIVRWFAISGGVIQLLAGAVVLAVSWRRGPCRATA